MVTGLLGFVTNRTQFRFFKNKGQYKEDQLNARVITDIVVNDYRINFFRILKISICCRDFQTQVV